MSSTYDDDTEEMTGYLHQGMLLGHLLAQGVRAAPVMQEENPNDYTPNKLTIKIPHPTKEKVTMRYTLVTEEVFKT